jgi:hypothetical protein
MAIVIVHSLQIADLNGQQRQLQICVGDVTDPEGAGPPDLLAISCARNSYVPIPGTIVRSLADRGVLLRELARRKARDWRATWQAWISEELPAEAPVRRIVCFEHGPWLDPASVVGNVFRAVSEFALETATGDLSLLRVPLLATGQQQADKLEMLEAILREAHAHLQAGLPILTAQLVLNDRNADLLALLVVAGRRLEENRAEWLAAAAAKASAFDFFVSYRRQDAALVESLVATMRNRRRGLRVFRDQESLPSGVFWKSQLLTKLYQCRQALCVITDTYVDSVECIDEFHAALCCSRKRGHFLLPLLSLRDRSVDTLPLSIRSVNLIPAACPPNRIEDVVDRILSDAPSTASA